MIMTLYIGTSSSFFFADIFHMQNIDGIAYRPENILYRTRDSDSDIVIADFGMYVMLLLFSSISSNAVYQCQASSWFRRTAIFRGR